MLESRNPALRRAAEAQQAPSMDQQRFDEQFDALTGQVAGDRMTIEGTVYKTLFLLLLTAATTFGVWMWAGGEPVGIPFAGFAFFPLIAVGIAFNGDLKNMPVTAP